MKDENFSLPAPVGNGASLKRRSLSSQRDSFYLEQFGTHPSSLSARAIIQAAEQDLRSRQFNARVNADKKRPVHERDGMANEHLRKYGFIGKHVSKANTAQELIKIALSDRQSGLGRVNANTYRIYSDADRLNEALTLLGIS